MNGFAYLIEASGAPVSATIDDAVRAEPELGWIHLSTQGEEAQGWLRDRAGLDGYVVEALTATESRPRCEAVGPGAFLNLRGRSTEEPLPSSDPLASVRVWAERGRVFTVTRKPLVAVDHVRAGVERGEVHDPGDLITAFATAITADLDPLVADLGDSLDSCEEQIDPDRIFELRQQVTRTRVTAIGYRRFLSPQRAALEKLATLPGDWLDESDRLHLAAAADRAARMVEELEAIRERASLIHEALTDLRAEQIDSRGLVISIVAMVFLPLTFLTGLLGMNVAGIPFAKEPWAFAGVVGGCVVLAASIAGYFVRRHWFKR